MTTLPDAPASGSVWVRSKIPLKEIIMVSVIGIAVAPRILAPMEERDDVIVTIEKGLDGDARGGKSRRQVSILFEDDWNDAVGATNGAAMPWVERRANLFVRGMRSPQQDGGIFSIGDVRLEVVEETEPCELMESKRTGLREALMPDWRGGVCCRVISGGAIRLGDPVVYSEG